MMCGRSVVLGAISVGASAMVACSGAASPTSSAAAVDVPPPASAPAPTTSAVATSAAPDGEARSRSVSADGCSATIKEGTKLHDAGHYDEAIATYRRGLETCGGGHGFLGEIGYSLAALGKFDEAADSYLAEIRAPGARPTAFGNLAEALPKLSKSKLSEVMAAGTKPEAPIFVPDIGGEYFWAQNVGCGGDGGVSDSQALIAHAGHQLDAIAYHCPDGTKRTTYFDFSADPSEQAFKKELEQKH